jgi:hypothetical protein
MSKRMIAAAISFLALGVSDAQAQRIEFASPIDYVRTDAGARAIVAADFDGDGILDVATASGTLNSVTILINGRATGGGLGALHHYTVDAGPFDIAVADVNEDGSPDLVVAAADANSINVLINRGDGTFDVTAVPAPGSPRGIAVGDFDRDGHIDIVYSSYALGTITVFFGDGAGAFASPLVAATGRNPQGVAVGDLDGDGMLDVVVANTGASPLNVFYGTPTGAFRRVDIAGAKQLYTVAIGDFDGDGRLDVAATTPSQASVFVYMNSASGLALTRALASPLSNRGIIAADFNKDGHADIAVANRGSNEIVLYAATIDGTLFRPAVTFPAGTGSRAIVAADIDGDGKVDVITGDEYAPHITLFYNRTIVTGPGAAAFELRALPGLEADVPLPSGALAAGDFNKNGVVDVVAGDAVVLDGVTAVKVAVNRPHVEYRQAVVGDFDRDGHLDFARTARVPDATSASGTADVVDLFLGDGAGGFAFDSTLTFDNVRALWATDQDGDRRTELVVWNLRPDNGFGMPVLEDIVASRTPDGVFGRSTVATLPPSATPVGMADMNGDHRPDLIYWDGDLQAVVVWTQTPVHGFTFGFESQTAGETLANAVLADLNEDGVPDVVGIGRSTNSLIVFLMGHGNFNPPVFAPIPGTTSRLVIADFDGDGRLDYLADDGTFATGHGDGRFTVARQIHLMFRDAIVADVDGDSLPDVVLSTATYAAMVLFNRGSVGANLPPIADVGRDITIPYQAQSGAPGVSVSGERSYDPNLDPLTYQWIDASGTQLGTSVTFDITGFSPGIHVLTLIVRDDRGGEARDSVTVTVTGSGEIVAYVDTASYHGAWTERVDPTAAAGIAAWDPNAGASKLNAPLANPVDYVEVAVHPDPALTYKLWLRLKAEINNWANDSVFVQFDGAVDAAGQPIYQIGSTSALSVNLEECLNCGVSGWGWRDDAWGAKGVVGTAVFRFSQLGGGVTRIRIQRREDGAMVDQVVLSSSTYKAARPGSANNDTLILPRTEF